MNNPMVFTRVLRFQYNNEDYDMFISDFNRYAFLKINKDGTYDFPTYEAFKVFAKHFSYDKVKYFSKKHGKFSFIPKVITGTGALILSSAILFNICATNNIDSNHIQAYSEYYAVGNTDGIYVTDDFKINTEYKKVDVYNVDALDVYFGIPNYTLEQVIDLINAKEDFDDDMKAFLVEFTTTMYNSYPNMDFRIFCENLKTLKIREFTRDEDLFLPGTVTAFYNVDDNEVGIKGGTDLTSGTRGAMTLRHEIGHVFTTISNAEKFGHNINFQFNKLSHGDLVGEALISYLTFKPYEDTYPEDVKNNYGYPLQVNYIQLMLESMPEFDYSVLLNCNIDFFEELLNKETEGIIDANVLVALIEEQGRDRSEGDGITIDETQYNEIYEVLATIYINRNLYPGMSEEEFNFHKEHFISVLGRGIVGEYIFGTDIPDTTYLNFDLVNEIFDNYAIENLDFEVQRTVASVR